MSFGRIFVSVNTKKGINLVIDQYTIKVYQYTIIVAIIIPYSGYIPCSAKFSRHLYFVEWPLHIKAFRCAIFVE